MFERILKKVKPDKKEQLEVTRKVKEFLSKLKLEDADYFLGGSYAKNTWLKGKHDIDIFIRFDNEENISDKLEKFIKKSFKKYERIHGSRDYFLIKFKNTDFELVPVLKINNYKEAKNITDVSPLHVKWVRENLNSDQCDDARLAKQFLKAAGCYGAETYIKGFSGYLIEILIKYYSSFLKFIENAGNWKYGETIDIMKNSTFQTDQKFPLTVIDPVQPNRNVASELSYEKFNLFLGYCNEFLRSDKNEIYFKERKFSIEGFDLIIAAIPLEGSKDVAGTKLLKVYEKILEEINNQNFNVIYSGWNWNKKALFCYKVGNEKLDKLEKYFGPPLDMKEDVKNFKTKYKGLQFGNENNKIFVIKPRKFNDVRQLIKHLIRNDENIKKRVKSISLK